MSSLVLLTASGVKPSNKEHGYRARLLSKKLVERNIIRHNELQGLGEDIYDYWELWTAFNLTKEEVMSVVTKENERNYNREIVERLRERYSDVNLDINQPTPRLIKQLRGTSVKKEDLEKVLEQIYGHQ